ncbi:MAG: amidohydrolase [Nakamurella sp.]
MKLDLLIRNACLLDPVSPGTGASSIGLLNGRIVGIDDDIGDLGAHRTVDAQGATILPGLHDAHVHTTSYGLGLSMLDLSGVTGLPPLLEAVAAYAGALPAGDWVIGSGYGLGLNPGTHPSRGSLDTAAGGRPVWLTHFSGHMCVLNTAALAAIGITSASSPGDHGGIGVDADGEPDGLLEESAMDLIKEYRGPSSIEDLAAAIGTATAIYAAEGVTTFVDAGIGSTGIDHSPVELAAYQLARETGRLHVRGQLMVHDAVLHPVRSHPDDGIDQGLDLGVRTGFGDDWLEIGAMKIWLDGTGANDAFDDDPTTLRRSIVTGARAGWQVAAHAMGDAALDLFLDALEEVSASGPSPGRTAGARPHRVEHGALIRPEQITRLARMGVVVAHQPSFLTTFGDVTLSMIDEAQRPNSFRCKSLLDAGVVVAGSSDRPVATGAPLAGVQAMVERTTESGTSFGAEEAIDARTALISYTRGGAHAAGRTHRSGALRPGYDADLVVLADDPTAVPTAQIAGIKVLATLVAGSVVHDASGLFDRSGRP